ncbi:MAG: sulfatase-like hydrolase/transferase [Acidobacteriota bacterium]|nr:sulfatase-like hydrolase/transferase [Acidobacteriota bacterium]
MRQTWIKPFGFVFVLSMIVFCITYDWFPRANVRWAAGVTRLQRQALESNYQLAEPRQTDERTWSYSIRDASVHNLGRLVQDQAVEDTHNIDRASFELSESPPAWAFVLSRFLLFSSLIAGLVGSLSTWMRGGGWQLLIRYSTLLLALPADICLRCSTSVQVIWRRWSRVIIAWGSGALAPVVVFVVLFDDVVATNVRELPYQPRLVQLFHVVAILVAGAGFLIISRFGDKKLIRLWLVAPWALLLFDVSGAALDVLPIGFAILSDGLIITATVGVAMVVPWPALQKVTTMVALVLFVQAVTAHVSLVQSFAAEASSDLVKKQTSTRNAASLANGPGNVYHILLDNYLAESYAALADEEGQDRLAGFVFFSRFNAQFPRTSSSELGMLHGRSPEPGMSIDDWSTTALREGFWHNLAEAGAGVWVYPIRRELCPDYAKVCVASSDIERQTQLRLARETTIDLWALRLIPPSLGRLVGARLSSSREDRHSLGFSLTTALRRLTGKPVHPVASLPTVSANPEQYFNLKQFDQLLLDEASRPARGQYIYYHGLIPHPYFLLDEQCQENRNNDYSPARYWGFAKCANLMVRRLVERLEQLGRLDDALIVVHADHGDLDFLASYREADEAFALDPVARRYQKADPTYHDSAMLEHLQSGDSAEWRSIAIEVFSSALLLVKFPYATAYLEDRRPVQMLDIAPTVLAHFGVSTEAYDGVEISLGPETREQVFYAHSRRFDGKLSKYRLGATGWKFVEDIPVTRVDH